MRFSQSSEQVSMSHIKAINKTLEQILTSFTTTLRLVWPIFYMQAILRMNIWCYTCSSLSLWLKCL